MKNKIRKWFIGLWIASHGFITMGCMTGVIMSFILMINSVGWKFIMSFACFIFCLIASVLLPYGIFEEFKDAIKDKDK